MRNLTVEQERDLLARQRDSLLELCPQAEQCGRVITVDEVYEAFLHDPADET